MSRFDRKVWRARRKESATGDSWQKWIARQLDAPVTVKTYFKPVELAEDGTPKPREVLHKQLIWPTVRAPWNWRPKKKPPKSLTAAPAPETPTEETADV
jgi:hypothetical protein